jgi:hypothetical protein
MMWVGMQADFYIGDETEEDRGEELSDLGG